MFVQTRGQDYRSTARSVSRARLTPVPNENAG